MDEKKVSALRRAFSGPETEADTVQQQDTNAMDSNIFFMIIILCRFLLLSLDVGEVDVHPVLE